MLNLITINDILIALVLAAFITWFINRAVEAMREQKTPDLEQVLKNCYALFPHEILQFQGEEYRRGMSIRLITNQNKTFEGKFLGINNDNMICLMTKGFIIAQAIKNIEQMEILE